MNIYKAGEDKMENLVLMKIKELLDRREKIKQSAGKEKIEKQHKQGKLTARERLDLLFDEGTFNEIDMFVKHQSKDFGLDKKDLPADGVITGFGLVNSKLVFAFSQDFMVAGGSAGLMHEKKIVKIINMAAKVGAPVIGFNDSGGARIQEGVDSLSGYGEIFYANAKYSGLIPQIALITGPCAGGAAYSPALMDFVIVVDNISKMFITGPEVIKAVTGEEVTAEQLGGAFVHSSISGNAHFRVPNEYEAINLVKRLLYYLPSNSKELPEEKNFTKPVDIIESFNEVLPSDEKKSYDMKIIIDLLVDENSFFEVMAEFAPNIITGFATIAGNVVGIVANQPKVMAGCLDINASDKAAYFIRFCNAFNIPLVNLVDVPGFLPGKNQELGGIIRHGAKMLYAYTEADVPKITVIVKKAYGGSYLAMCSKEMGADFVFAWPTAEIAVMGPQGAANIIFRKEIAASSDPEKTREEKIKEYKEKFANPYVAASKGYIDDIILPSETRVKVATALEVLKTKSKEIINKKIGLTPL